MRKRIILGPPGTGKTTTLLNIVDEKMRSGISPQRIAYVSFTRKAAHEAQDRAIDRFKFEREDMPYFKTLHSLASMVMGMKQDDYMYKPQYKEIGQLIGLPGLTGERADSKTETRANNLGNHLLSVISVARNMKMTLRDYVRSMSQLEWQYSIGRYGKELKRLVVALDQYKKTYGLRDYTDLMIEPVYLEYPAIDVDVAIIDEAQDLTAVQWDFIHWMFRDVKELYIAGDDDQAIYEWNGADVQQFLHLDGEKQVLNKSYRLPRRPWMVANHLSNRISERYEKDWSHNGTEGEVYRIADVKYAVDIVEGGDWLVLARNGHHLNTIKGWLMNKGVPIKFSNYDVIKPDEMGAIHAWANLAQGKQISGLRAKQLFALLRTQKHIGYGGKARMEHVEDTDQFSFDELRDQFSLLTDPAANWWDILQKIPQHKVDYYRRVRRHGESLKNPRVTLSTIHKVKGGEADNVLLLTDMSRQTHRMYAHNLRAADEEHRVFYVGASRARRRLIICNKQSLNGYPFPKFSEKAKVA